MRDMNKIAIVGRPNVGKSTLFNRLLRKRTAIVDRISGVTRDRLYGEVDWDGRTLNIIDTGGVDFDEKDALKKKILEQIKVSIGEADLIIFVADAIDGLMPLDSEISRILRQSGKDVIVVANKVDNDNLTSGIHAFSRLGWDIIVPISAAHGLGINKLLDIILNKIPKSEQKIAEKTFLKIAVIGRPNVGKSTFVNSVLNESRMIVDERPGTTRDAVDVKFKRNNENWLFIDTAGVRKKRKVKEPLEYYSVNRALKSVDRSDVIIFMIDGWDGLRKQDMQLIDYIMKNGKPCVIAINKWDLVSKVTKREYHELIVKRLSEYWFIPSIFISALKKENIDSVLKKTEELFKQANAKIGTKSLNKLLHNLELVRPSKIYYAAQVNTNPPNFLLFVNTIPNEHCINHIKNRIHKEFELEVPIRIQFREKKRAH